MERLRQKKPHIAVIGDIMIDHYIWGSCERISPEAPVQVVVTESETSVLGGAGNVVRNLTALDAKVSLYSVIGDDNAAEEMEALLRECQLEKSVVITQSGRKTSKKTRVVASSQQILRYDAESISLIDERSQVALFEAVQSTLQNYDAILLSDYAKGVLTPSLTQQLIVEAKRYAIPILVDPKGSDYSKYKGATLLTPNRKEAQIAANQTLESTTLLKEVGFSLKEQLHLDAMLITLSEDGIALFEEHMEVIPTVAQEVFDVTGAGDTVLAALGVAISSGLNLYEACEFANKAAAVVVAKVGSATATLNEVEEYTHKLHQGKAGSKLKDFTQIQRIAKRLKEQNKRVVFTNGCFDILHRGHTSYLEAAKERGDILIVGVNSDESIKRLKGESRPINRLEDRAYILAALESVDYVVTFSEETPYELIKMVQPHILVKGADYEGKEVIGADLAERVELIAFVEGRSTTKMIEQIQKDGTC
jgi:D-beta-D-heptose 7-phosphate kinase/D-beta-D-heptose 1-phosphate adenosyltransferase